MGKEEENLVHFLQSVNPAHVWGNITSFLQNGHSKDILKPLDKKRIRLVDTSEHPPPGDVFTQDLNDR
jgi:hypothetical protein